MIILENNVNYSYIQEPKNTKLSMYSESIAPEL